MAGKLFNMQISQSLVESNSAVVKDTDPKKLNGIYRARFFVKTDEGF